jgi:hypothetical protein
MVFHDNAEWLKNRLQSMGPAEVISRIADVGRHLALRATLKGLQRRPRTRLRKLDGPYRLPDIKQQLDRISTRTKDGVIAAANQWLDHRASFFSLKDIPLGDPIDWHRDYSSGTVGPISYSGLINARDRNKVGDIKYVWELNRLQHLILLALASAWTGNATYWHEIEKRVLSWDKSNPFMMGVNWKSPLEAGIRLISWAYVSFITQDLSQQRETFHKFLRNTIYQHQYFIRKFYSKNSSANNHLIGEMAGLYVGSVIWPWYPESASWRFFARQKLIDEIDRQVEADGVGRERATEYQMFVFEFFLLAGALGQAVGDPFPVAYWDRLNRMAAFLLAISNRVGDFPMFGDGDSGQVVSLPEITAERLRSLIGMGQFVEGAVSPDLRSLLLLWGQSPREIPIGPVRSSGQSLQQFPDGGYHVLATDRGGENEIVIVFDAGPLGLPPLNAHGHADALSFWLSYGGQEFFIDPGTFTYYSSAQWRSYFRGTSAHNTLRVDGEDQSVPGGTFLWREVADCRIKDIEDTDEFVEVRGSHDGYRRLSDPVIHTRALRLFKKSRTLVITDRLECQGIHDIELFFHFAKNCEVRQLGPNSFEVLNCDKRLAIRVDSRVQPELYRGCENPILGWVSPTFGVKESCFTLVARADITGSTQFLTEISAI